eukprot:jgi/Mesen1/2285/ME000154S01453
MASTKGLMPITRPFLAKFYDKYPFDPIVPEVTKLHDRLQVLCDELDAERQKQGGDLFMVESLIFEAPHKIDENLWKNREQIEEIMRLLQKEHWPAGLAKIDNSLAERFEVVSTTLTEELKKLMSVIQTYQSTTSEKVFQMVLTYMPQDFRGTLIKQQRERSEKKRQLEVETLITSGGTIGQKYALLWQQQMDRRKTLAAMGSATGVYKTLVKYLVGVPQVLLDFVRQINDHNGPMEEQRERYGPPLYELTKFSNRLRVFAAVWWSVYDSTTPNAEEHITILEESVKLYCSEFTRFIVTLKSIFENAPFLISAEDAIPDDEKNKGDDFKEITVAPGYKHEVPLTVECEGSVVAWDFKLTMGKDVGFSVDFVDSSGTKTGMLPYQRVEVHQGSFNAPGVGSYTLVWDNTYSILNRKTIRYKVDVIPPVVSVEEEAAEEALAHAAGGDSTPAPEEAA